MLSISTSAASVLLEDKQDDQSKKQLLIDLSTCIENQSVDPKNRRNKQLQRFVRNLRFKKFCFVESAMRLVENALFLGNDWHQPLCVFRAGDSVRMLTVHDITTY